MNELFLIKTKDNKLLLYDREKFLDFCNKAKSLDWSFYVGSLNNNIPFKSSKTLPEKEFLNLFKVEEIKSILKYKTVRFGSKIISCMPLFEKKIYLKYGERIDWKDEFNISF